MRTFWSDVLTKSSVAQPAVVFGGDFNCTLVQWTLCLKDMHHSHASKKTVQSCQSKAIPRPGDNALVVNAIAFQEESGFGKSYDNNAFTDAHDVVLVPLCLCNKGTQQRCTTCFKSSHRPRCPRSATSMPSVHETSARRSERKCCAAEEA